MGAALGYPFLDTDTLIETSAKCSIPEIFASDGEDAFRELETQVLQVRAPLLPACHALEAVCCCLRRCSCLTLGQRRAGGRA